MSAFRRILLPGVLFALLLFAGGAAGLPGNLILQVPDWNQPANYGIAGYIGWCAPTAGGNVAGYWEDVKGAVGLSDRQVMPGGPPYANNPGTYRQGLFNDGQIEMGYYMGTNGWGPPPNTQFPPNTFAGTPLPNIGPGFQSYAQAAWNDPGSGIVKVAYPNTAIGLDMGPATGVMWANYTAEIDAGRPAMVSFSTWVNPMQFQGFVSIDGFPIYAIETYAWGSTDPHTVVGVGYIDLTPGFQNDGMDEWFVCQDGWPGPGGGLGGTGPYVRVPVSAQWLQNDYVYAVPEPALSSYAALGAAVWIVYARRRKRGLRTY